MKKDLLFLIFGAILLIFIKDATRFIGAGFISLGVTYFLLDGISDLKENSNIKKRKCK